MPVTKARLLLAAALTLALALALAGGACKKSPDALLLLEIRASGPFVAPVASVRLSVPDHAGWPVHVVSANLGAGGVKVGYYVPGGAGPVTVRAEALDAHDCLLGEGTLTFPATADGATSQPMTLFARPLPSSTCNGDGGVDATSGGDAEADATPMDGGTDGGADGAGMDAGGAEGGDDGGVPDGSGADGAGDGDIDGPTGDGGTDGPTESNPSPDGGDDAASDAPAGG